MKSPNAKTVITQLRIGKALLGNTREDLKNDERVRALNLHVDLKVAEDILTYVIDKLLELGYAKSGIPLLKPLACSCKRIHSEVSPDHKFSDDPDLGGYFWNCPCQSTLFVNADQVRKEE